ncbi:hypothetical protein SETIT_2G222700v2 [Setaria italica]|uniref:Uncharacterized protein n=1 Tax=Setaria italica TaxID=4555 RepID=K3ZZE5_SETIT|nr:hypothetical protein SETIT_2G222700v2 [Setaria italica]
MGTLAGHVAPGASFVIINLWQLFSLFLLRSGSYHVSISLGLLIFDPITIHMDQVRAANCDAVSQLVAAAASAQQLLVFHLHSIVIAVMLATTLLRIPCLRSFRVSLVWSASLVFQGIWFITMGVMLCTPLEEGHNIVRCRTDEALDRAKSLINLQFSWYLTVPLVKADSGRDSDNGRFSIGDEHDNDDDLKAAKCGFGQVVNGTRPMEIER